MSLLRTFIAVDISPVLQTAIEQSALPLRRELGNSLVRWVDSRAIHLTLKFLGDVSPAAIPPLTRTLQTEADLIPAFDLAIGGLGSFPSPRRALVLWVEIQAPAALEALYRGIESACGRLGYAAETKPFHPHLTLGRVRQGLSAADGQKIRRVLEAQTIDYLGTARVDSVHLYKSDLQPSGAVYTRLYSAPLQSNPN